jgi:pyruvate formate lyase activating enzyme
MAAIGQWLGDVPAYFIQNFTDSGDVLASGLSGFTPSELTALLEAVKPYVPAARVRGM